MKYWVRVVLPVCLCLFAVVVLTACSRQGGVDAGERDGEGADVVPVARIVSLAPSLTGMVLTLGAGERLVGVSEHCPRDRFSAGVAPANVGRIDEPALERLVALRPDVVLVSNLTPPPMEARIRAMGLRTERFEHGGLAGVMVDFRRLGKLLGERARAGEVLSAWQRVVDRVAARAAAGGDGDGDGNRPRVVFLFDFQELFSVGKGSFIGDLIEHAGGDNLGARSGVAWPRLSREFVLEQQPTHLIAILPGRFDAGSRGQEILEGLREESFWRRIPAVRVGRILWLPSGAAGVPGEATFHTLEAISLFLFPEERP